MTYHTSPYRLFDIHERGKTRHIAALPFYPDRIVHWAIVLATQDIFMKNYISQTYAAIPGRGTHKALRDVKHALRSPDCGDWCLKIDVHHYFENIDKDILMKMVERRIKDPRVLELYRRVVMEYDGPGIPIGNLTSQYLANLYLSGIDHFFKEKYHARCYFRYMDDIVILGRSSAWLRRVKTELERKLAGLKLTLNPKWQIFPVSSRGVDFVGYRIWPDFTLVRTSTKRRMIRKVRRMTAELNNGLKGDASALGCVSAYNGILSWCDGQRLYRRYIRPLVRLLEGTKCRI